MQGEDQMTDGLYNDQIETVMAKYKDKGWKGCIMRDEIKTKILPGLKKHSRVSFILNTDKHNMPGKHWQAIYIDARNGPESSNSLEFYDSFGESIPEKLLNDCKLNIKKLKPENYLKLKENKIIHQSDMSQNCGYFAMRFLIDRYRGKSFSDATGFDKINLNRINKNEKEIEKLKDLPPFKYVTDL